MQSQDAEVWQETVSSQTFCQHDAGLEDQQYLASLRRPKLMQSSFLKYREGRLLGHGDHQPGVMTQNRITQKRPSLLQDDG